MSGSSAPSIRILAAASLIASLWAGDAPGEEVRLPVTRDTWFSGVGAEADANLGGSPKLKLKSYQELSVVDVDPAPLRGRVVLRAMLHLRSTGEPRLKRVTVGTIAAEWTEGTSTTYAAEAGASTFRHRRHPDVPWTIPGGDLCDVILGQGGSLWRSAEASPPDAEGWQAIPVHPMMLAARVAGISRGFVVFDDTGSEWTRDGDKFARQPFPNRFVASRDSNNASAPYFTVDLGAEDHAPPDAPSGLAADVADLPAGEAFLRWETPADPGQGGTIGFLVAVDGRDVPRYLVPPANAAGRPVRMHLRDLGLAAGARVAISVRAVDGAGNLGPEARAEIRVSDRVAKPLPGATPSDPSREPAPLPKLGMAGVAVIDELDKVDPTTGRLVGDSDPNDLSANHLWDAKAKKVTIRAARNEFVGIQVVFQGPVTELRPSLIFEGYTFPGISAEFGRVENVATRRGPMPDPVVSPLPRPLDFPVGPGLKSGSMLVDLYVPHGTRVGDHLGKLTLKSGKDSLTIDLTVQVWDFDLPDALSFLPEMNCYGLPDDERPFYRMAHKHRTVLNRVPYNQRGEVAPGLAPTGEADNLDWSGWDKRFGPLLDGSAFGDLPRKGVPLEVFYLPLNENWPTPIGPNYNGDYWADKAFPASYRAAFVAASRRFATHLDAKGWRRTIFLGFLNNKVDFKGGPRGWEGGSSPWLLDEPASFQDFWALRYFGGAFQEGVAAAARAPGARLAFRADISRPQWQRDSLDGVLDYNVVDSEFRRRRRLVLDRKRREGQVVLEYGTANAVDESNVQGAAWCLDAWSLGLDGVVPWQTIGKAESWKAGDELALFYPPRERVDRFPSASIRLKALRRGQQDVEYLALLAAHEGEARWAIGSKVREALGLAGEAKESDDDEAGSVRYAKVRSRDLRALRDRVGRALSEAKVKASGKGIDWSPRPIAADAGR